jgi:hypothetical protein
MTPADADLDQVVARERRLLDPDVRADVDAVTELLHPDFLEYGASGRVWDRDSIIAALAQDPGVSGAAKDLRATRLADDVILLTYRVEGERRSLRSSVWVSDGDGWRVRFHQGTLLN